MTHYSKSPNTESAEKIIADVTDHDRADHQGFNAPEGPTALYLYALQAIRALSPSDLSSTDRLVFLVLAASCPVGTWDCQMTREDLAGLTGLGVKAVTAAVAALMARGLVSIISEKPRVYRVHMADVNRTPAATAAVTVDVDRLVADQTDLVVRCLLYSHGFWFIRQPQYKVLVDGDEARAAAGEWKADFALNPRLVIECGPLVTPEKKQRDADKRAFCEKYGITYFTVQTHAEAVALVPVLQGLLAKDRWMGASEAALRRLRAIVPDNKLGPLDEALRSYSAPVPASVMTVVPRPWATRPATVAEPVMDKEMNLQSVGGSGDAAFLRRMLSEADSILRGDKPVDLAALRSYLQPVMNKIEEGIDPALRERRRAEREAQAAKEREEEAYWLRPREPKAPVSESDKAEATVDQGTGSDTFLAEINAGRDSEDQVSLSDIL